MLRFESLAKHVPDVPIPESYSVINEPVEAINEPSEEMAIESTITL